MRRFTFAAVFFIASWSTLLPIFSPTAGASDGSPRLLASFGEGFSSRTVAADGTLVWAAATDSSNSPVVNGMEESGGAVRMVVQLPAPFIAMAEDGPHPVVLAGRRVGFLSDNSPDFHLMPGDIRGNELGMCRSNSAFWVVTDSSVYEYLDFSSAPIVTPLANPQAAACGPLGLYVLGGVGFTFYAESGSSQLVDVSSTDYGAGASDYVGIYVIGQTLELMGNYDGTGSLLFSVNDLNVADAQNNFTSDTCFSYQGSGEIISYLGDQYAVCPLSDLQNLSGPDWYSTGVLSEQDAGINSNYDEGASATFAADANGIWSMYGGRLLHYGIAPAVSGSIVNRQSEEISWSGPTGLTCDVDSSSDRRTWRTVATTDHQNVTVSLSPGAAAYYRVRCPNASPSNSIALVSTLSTPHVIAVQTASGIPVMGGMLRWSTANGSITSNALTPLSHNGRAILATGPGGRLNLTLKQVEMPDGTAASGSLQMLAMNVPSVARLPFETRSGQFTIRVLLPSGAPARGAQVVAARLYCYEQVGSMVFSETAATNVASCRPGSDFNGGYGSSYDAWVRGSLTTNSSGDATFAAFPTASSYATVTYGTRSVVLHASAAITASVVVVHLP